METVQEQHDKLFSDPTRPPLCIDCEYKATSHSGDFKLMRCLAPENYLGVNLVDGSKVFKVEFCINHRQYTRLDTCSVKGEWFKLYIKPPESITYTTASNNVTPKDQFALLRAKKVTSSQLDSI